MSPEGLTSLLLGSGNVCFSHGRPKAHNWRDLDPVMEDLMLRLNVSAEKELSMKR